MTKEYLIKNKIYDLDLYNELTEQYWGKETPQDIKEYMSYCYHYEEYEAGLL